MIKFHALVRSATAILSSRLHGKIWMQRSIDIKPMAIWSTVPVPVVGLLPVPDSDLKRNS